MDRSGILHNGANNLRTDYQYYEIATQSPVASFEHSVCIGGSTDKRLWERLMTVLRRCCSPLQIECDLLPFKFIFLKNMGMMPAITILIISPSDMHCFCRREAGIFRGFAVWRRGTASGPGPLAGFPDGTE